MLEKAIEFFKHNSITFRQLSEKNLYQDVQDYLDNKFMLKSLVNNRYSFNSNLKLIVSSIYCSLTNSWCLMIADALLVRDLDHCRC